MISNETLIRLLESKGLVVDRPSSRGACGPAYAEEARQAARDWRRTLSARVFDAYTDIELTEALSDLLVSA